MTFDGVAKAGVVPLWSLRREGTRNPLKLVAAWLALATIARIWPLTCVYVGRSVPNLPLVLLGFALIKVA